MDSIRIRLAAAAGLAAGFLAVGSVASAQDKSALNSPPLRFTAVAVNVSNVGPSGAGQVDLRINRWTTPGERERLIAKFKEKGADALLDALRDAPKVGTISTPGSLAYDLHYATEQNLPDGGKRIVLATDRPIGFWEASNQPRTLDYPFLLIEIHVDADGRGEGKLARAAKLTLSNDVLIIENYANQPVMLNEVRLRK
jgi:hypothetical protein